VSLSPNRISKSDTVRRSEERSKSRKRKSKKKGGWVGGGGGGGVGGVGGGGGMRAAEKSVINSGENPTYISTIIKRFCHKKKGPERGFGATPDKHMKKGEPSEGSYKVLDQRPRQRRKKVTII